MTIVELLVALALSGAVLAALASGMIAIQRATSTVDVRTENIDNARIAIAAISRDLRAAAPGPDGQAPFSVAEPNEARFFALLGDAATPVRLHLFIDGDDRLVETITRPEIDTATGVVTYPPANEQQRFVASFVFNRADEPLFNYFELDMGQPVALDSPVTCDPSAVDGDPCDSIQLVELDLRISRDQAAQTVPQRVATEVRLPNQGGQ